MLTAILLIVGFIGLAFIGIRQHLHIVSTNAKFTSFYNGVQRDLEELKIDLRKDLTDYKVFIDRNLETRLGLVLDAGMTASERIAKAVADRGDANLKDYVDSCLESVQQATSELKVGARYE